MATVSQALNARLSAIAGLTSLVGDRIYPGVIPAGTAEPYVAFLRIDEDEEEAMQENADIQETMFEVMAVGASYDSCEAMYEQIRTACRRFSGTVATVEVADMLLRGGEGPLWDDEAQLYEATQRVAVRYRRP